MRHIEAYSLGFLTFSTELRIKVRESQKYKNKTYFSEKLSFSEFLFYFLLNLNYITHQAYKRVKCILLFRASTPFAILKIINCVRIPFTIRLTMLLNKIPSV